MELAMMLRRILLILCCLSLTRVSVGYSPDDDKEDDNINDNDKYFVDPVPEDIRLKDHNDQTDIEGSNSLEPDSQRTVVGDYDAIAAPTSDHQFDSKRVKRGIKYHDDKWEHDIPYVIDSSYAEHASPPSKTLLILKLAMRRIMDNVCVRYIDVTARWNSSNPQWFTENGYPNNAYLLVKAGSMCMGSTGYGSGQGHRDIYPCFDFDINTHELLHTLGGLHTQNIPRRDNYLTINWDNIRPDLQYSYSKTTDPTVIDAGFDSKSALLYGDSVWNRNGLETYYPIRDDIFHLASFPPSERTIFYELNVLHKCSERFCGSGHVDCGLGYHALYKGKCQCVCPPEFDPATNCTRVFNQHNSQATWPQTPMGVFAAGSNEECPDGFDSLPAWFHIEGPRKPFQGSLPTLFPVKGNSMSFPVCYKKGPEPDKIDWESWFIGSSICIMKPANANCGGEFTQSTISFLADKEVRHNSSGLGDIKIKDKNVTINFCCKSLYYNNYVLDLPNRVPFQLVVNSHCPRVQGMREYEGFVSIYAKNQTATRHEPDHHFLENEIQLYVCYLLPPVYGCNEEIFLNSQTRSVTITTPGFGQARDPNRRCIYYFSVPQFSKIRVTFHKYDLPEDDYFYVKRFYKYQSPFRIDNSKPPHQIISEGEFLLMEYWSSWQRSSYQGANFTVDALLAEDFCYNATTRGEDYFGDTSISETYEDCLPWSQVTDCHDFPKDGLNPVWLFSSGNKCRNPGGKLLQPWCYTYKNGTNCRKRYCNVCNFLAARDELTMCDELKKQDPQFCQSGIQRFGCFKTCGFKQESARRSTCRTPNVPSDGKLTVPAKRSYLEGETVTVNCSVEAFRKTQWEMRCTKSGWTKLESACTDCPLGWTPYSNRCLFIPDFKRNVREAEKTCKSYGDSGTLFRIYNENDSQALRRYKNFMGNRYAETTWISGERRSNKKWYFTNTEVTMTYHNWSANHVKRVQDPGFNCLRMAAEDQWFAGGMVPEKCDETDNKKYFVCQLSSYNAKCQDITSTETCESILAAYPRFCTDKRFKNKGILLCKKSCGACAKNAECRVPSNKSFKSVSGSESVVAGQVVSLRCNSGYYYVSGNLELACSSSGNLIGDLPSCRDSPVEQDVNLNAVIRRKHTLSEGAVLLLSDNKIRVPFDGKISKWYYYCKKPGMIYFLVYRFKSSSYTFIGSNNVTCQAGWKWSLNVQTDTQISAQKGDIVGVYSPEKDTFRISDCTGAHDQIVKYDFASVKNVSDLQSLQFTEAKCMIPALGYRIDPE